MTEKGQLAEEGLFHVKTFVILWLFGSGIRGLVPSRHWLQELRVNFGGGLRVSGLCDPQRF